MMHKFASDSVVMFDVCSAAFKQRFISFRLESRLRAWLFQVSLVSFASVLLSFSVGCNVQTGIAPIEPILKQSSQRDFGFEGVWVANVESDFPDEAKSEKMTISRNKESNYQISIESESHVGKNEHLLNFQAVELSEEFDHAIVEIEHESGAGLFGRRLAIALVEENRLHVWMIDGKKIGSLLYDDGHGAVIEHHAFSSTIRCKPKQLLSTIRKHCKNVVGRAWSLQRKDVE